MPGVLAASMAKHVMPSSAVRAITKYKSARDPPEINALEPLSTYSSPSLRAVVLRLCASEPLPGSVRQ